MPRARCPHCQSIQEVEAPPAGAAGRHTCSGCGKGFSVRATAAARGSTLKLGGGASPPGNRAPADTPSRMGPYEIRGVLGAGGMGVVYRGWDPSLGRQVAVKTLKADVALDPEYRERFLREARAAAALSHPNLVPIYFIGEEGGLPFFAMELLEGRSLEALVREEGRISPARAVEWIRQAAAGLQAAASREIVHRDIKPSNLVLASDGTLKVTDFGLARLAAGDAGLTLAGEVLGSPNYMAPEQASGQPADQRSDIYSLGATFYELVTGRPPFDGPTPVSILLKHAREPLKSPRQFCPDLPYPLVTLVQRMLAKRPEERPQSYDLLLRELDRLAQGPAAGVTPRSQAYPPLPRRTAPPANAAAHTRLPGSWILVPLLILAFLAGWGLLRRLEGARRSAPLSPAEPAGTSATSSGTQVLSSTSEIDPPALGQRPARRGALSLPPRLERMREMARANLEFVTNTHEIGADGRLRVMGSVINLGPGRASDVWIEISLADSSGRLLDSARVLLVPSLLGPRQTGSFEAFFPDPHQPLSIRTELGWNS